MHFPFLLVSEGEQTWTYTSHQKGERCAHSKQWIPADGPPSFLSFLPNIWGYAVVTYMFPEHNCVTYHLVTSDAAGMGLPESETQNTYSPRGINQTKACKGTSGIHQDSISQSISVYKVEDQHLYSWLWPIHMYSVGQEDGIPPIWAGCIGWSLFGLNKETMKTFPFGFQTICSLGAEKSVENLFNYDLFLSFGRKSNRNVEARRYNKKAHVCFDIALEDATILWSWL